jgi:hypothetical protein
MFVITGVRNVPSPLPKKMYKFVEENETISTSGFPSPLKSPVAIRLPGTLRGTPVVNVPSPLPRSTVPSAATRSGLPSPLKSALTVCPLPG